MAKHLVLFELDRSKIPIDPKERGAAWGAMLDMLKQDIKEGVTKDWGSFLGEHGGIWSVKQVRWSLECA